MPHDRAIPPRWLTWPWLLGCLALDTVLLTMLVLVILLALGRL